MAKKEEKRKPGAPLVGEEPLLRKSIGLPPEDWAELEKIADKEGRKLAAVVREAVQSYLEAMGK